MRILFSGTPGIAVPSLQRLLQGDHDVVGVLTNPDRASGRGRRVAESPVKVCAADAGIPILQPPTLRTDARRAVAELNPDLLVCVAYGRIFGPKFLSLFARGGINLHPSLLPRFRGPAPIPAAILAGDATTGVSIQRLALEMDAGDVLAQHEVPLAGSETTASLSAQLAELGATMLCEVVDGLAAGTAAGSAQQAQLATYTMTIRKAHGLIDWRLPAAMIDRAVRAYTPWPVAYTTLAGERLSVLAAHPEDGNQDAAGAVPGQVIEARKRVVVATGHGFLSVDRLQLQGRKPLDAAAFCNGVELAGVVLGRH